MTDCSEGYDINEFLGKDTEFERTYLKDIHNKGNEQDVLDLHTYFWCKAFDVCPICNEWLVQRIKPELIP